MRSKMRVIFGNCTKQGRELFKGGRSKGFGNWFTRQFGALAALGATIYAAIIPATVVAMLSYFNRSRHIPETAAERKTFQEVLIRTPVGKTSLAAGFISGIVAAYQTNKAGKNWASSEKALSKLIRTTRRQRNSAASSTKNAAANSPPPPHHPPRAHHHPPPHQHQQHQELQRPRIARRDDPRVVCQRVPQRRVRQPHQLAQAPHKDVQRVRQIDTEVHHMPRQRAKAAEPRAQDAQERLGRGWRWPQGEREGVRRAFASRECRKGRHECATTGGKQRRGMWAYRWCRRRWATGVASTRTASQGVDASGEGCIVTRQSPWSSLSLSNGTR